jgi:hypothetical protein
MGNKNFGKDKNAQKMNTSEIEPEVEEMKVEEMVETEITEKKPRAVAVTLKEKMNVYKMVGEGKGTVDDLVAAGVTPRVAKVSLKALAKENMIKNSYVVVQ